MTRKQALEECRDLWEWLAQHPKAEKNKSPFYPKGYVHQCPCCEFVKRKIGSCDSRECHSLLSRQIELCPLKSLWPRGCEAKGSPYRLWSDIGWEGTTDEEWEDRSNAAQEIADAAQAELDAIEDAEQKPLDIMEAD